MDNTWGLPSLNAGPDKGDTSARGLALEKNPPPFAVAAESFECMSAERSGSSSVVHP